MKHGFRFATIFAVVLALGACRAPATGGEDSATSMELKIYTVPSAQTRQLEDALGEALGKQANVSVPAPGTLLVYAPREAQASIGDALSALDQKDLNRDETAVAFHFWIVDAEAGAGADDKALEPLAASLDALRRTLGPMHFRVQQTAASLTASGRHGRLTMSAPSGYLRTFDFAVGAATDQGVAISLDYQDDGPAGLRKFRTQVGARFGEYLVLAQAPGACTVNLPPSAPTTACPDEPPVLQLLIVRVDRTNKRA